mmetsp:Transcript_44030/g.95850  ORF Transcript_44030/g.95850 Transcript_44030/m.95850 type:complete len:369 (+) Transcript_44030:57-1163(+)
MLKWISLIAFCAQNSLNPIVFRLAGTEAIASESASTAVILLCTEATKLFLSFLFFFAETRLSLGKTFSGVRDVFFSNFRSNLRLGVPSVVYVAQNAFLQWAASDVSAACWQLTYQGKTLVTAAFSVLLLGKRFKRVQWLAIFIMGLGIAMVQLSSSEETEQKSMANASEQLPVRGFLLLVAAACCSGFASVYTEMVFKQGSQSTRGNQGNPTSVWLQNMVMAFFSMALNVTMGIAEESANAMALPTEPRPLFYGFTMKTWLLVLSNGVGGLLVAMVIKHADNILRSFASAIATINCTVISVFVFGFKLEEIFGLGSTIVILSTLLYGNIIKLPGEWWNSEPCLAPTHIPNHIPLSVTETELGRSQSKD